MIAKRMRQADISSMLANKCSQGWIFPFLILQGWFLYAEDDEIFSLAGDFNPSKHSERGILLVEGYQPLAWDKKMMIGKHNGIQTCGDCSAHLFDFGRTPASRPFFGVYMQVNLHVALDWKGIQGFLLARRLSLYQARAARLAE